MFFVFKINTVEMWHQCWSIVAFVLEIEAQFRRNQAFSIVMGTCFQFALNLGHVDQSGSFQTREEIFGTQLAYPGKSKEHEVEAFQL